MLQKLVIKVLNAVLLKTGTTLHSSKLFEIIWIVNSLEIIRIVQKSLEITSKKYLSRLLAILS